MSIRILLFILFIVVFQSPVYAYTPVQATQDEAGRTIYTISDIFKQVDDSVTVAMSLHAKRFMDGHYEYSITIRYENIDKIALNIPKGATLSFLSDGAKSDLSGDGSAGSRKYVIWHLYSSEEVDDISSLSNKDKDNALWKESAEYPVPLSVLQQMIDAADVKMKIQGEKSSLMYMVPKDTLIDIRHFIIQHSAN